MIVQIHKYDQDQSWHITSRRSVQRTRADAVQLHDVTASKTGVTGYLQALHGHDSKVSFRKFWGGPLQVFRYPEPQDTRFAEFQEGLLIDKETREPILSASTIIFDVSSIIYRPSHTGDQK